MPLSGGVSVLKRMMPFMLSCEEVRFEVGADPRHRSWGQRVHLLMCGACGYYVRTMQALDQQIESTLRSVTGHSEAPPPYDELKRPAPGQSSE